MAILDYQDSNYRFTDPIRLFKANDPYYFEVENIPLKQLQENCLWLKDQLYNLSVTADVNDLGRSNLKELRPYANGGDRIVYVKPGRYTARINDASSKRPLAYLSKVLGEGVGEVDQYQAAAPNPGNLDNDVNEKLITALETFKSTLAQDALAMNGLAERAFTWPVYNSDTPISTTGVVLTSDSTISYGGVDLNFAGNQADLSPAVISQALLWAKSDNSTVESVILDTFSISNANSGWSKLPRLENYFIKKWRGVARLAIVDVDTELSIEVPAFDSEDFSYTNSEGTTSPVTGVQSRIDLIFIYSKPVDVSGVNILTNTEKQKITKPQLGIIKGAGIRSTFKESSNLLKDYIVSTGETQSILASPGDQFNEDLGFSSASGNDLAYDIRGSFPAPDDIMNLAPLLSEKLESEAYELVGQSILPVAYVWVSSDSQVVLPTDVIDIRPFFRTAELAYNERAGIAAAFPQLSLANPAVGKAQLDYELYRLNNNLIEYVDGELVEVLTLKSDVIRERSRLFYQETDATSNDLDFDPTLWQSANNPNITSHVDKNFGDDGKINGWSFNLTDLAQDYFYTSIGSTLPTLLEQYSVYVTLGFYSHITSKTGQSDTRANVTILAGAYRDTLLGPGRKAINALYSSVNNSIIRNSLGSEYIISLAKGEFGDQWTGYYVNETSNNLHPGYAQGLSLAHSNSVGSYRPSGNVNESYRSTNYNTKEVLLNPDSTITFPQGPKIELFVGRSRQRCSDNEFLIQGYIEGFRLVPKGNAYPSNP